MKYSFVTIEREYGSAGTKIARQLAETCGIPCYGHEILEAVAEKFSTSSESIDRYEESASSSLLYTISVIGRVSSGGEAFISPEARVFMEEQAEIRRLADNGPAVFLGHCACEALKNRKGVLKVFICAGDEEKKQRIIQDYRIESSRADHVRRQFDKKRANYYFANTARRWEDFRGYDMVLNSSDLGIDGCVTAIKGLVKHSE
ncbi:cytidylate kinase-like family protein [Ruminococcus sp. Marseille-P6503]|uniref:cytidylate kinase-like family protein n=1 Tax=Ruminococcus sp. Marseille-P6503 TaxID=2364796 RepID=UPI000F549DF2|nr:cytidylate kinase-like family protein [Ruminococcus sp. Marseille-P6503]